MRIVPFIISAMITIGLIVILNIPLTIADSKTPPIGSFLSPQHGFWQNAEPSDYNYSETITFPYYLKRNVTVYFDKRLVPHIYAEKESDAYFIQGSLV
jgi:penicillin amidase